MKKEVAEAAGIDLRSGLRAFANNKIIYDRFLLGFASDTHLQDAKQAYEAGDLPKVVELLEQLEGLTKKLGMLAYSETVAGLKEQINSGDTVVSFEPAQDCHDKVMKAFQE